MGEILNYRPFIAWLDPRISGLWAHTYVVHGFNKLNNAMELRLSDPQQGPSVINPQNPPWAEDWFQPWDNMLRSHSSGQLLPVGLGDTNNEHKGDIAVSNRPTGGACVTIHLPYAASLSGVTKMERQSAR